jgi:uncharacterized LabA/DUF88 family protein
MAHYLPFSPPRNSKYMLFVDGENLAIRYKNVLAESGLVAETHIKHLENLYVWSKHANRRNHEQVALIRSYFYTCAKGDTAKIESIEDDLIQLGISDPRVFKKNNNRKSKRVDITLATDMLSHAYNDNYDIAVLVAGDEDYVPLVQEIKRKGKQVALWFFESGLSRHLKNECDLFFDISEILLKKSEYINNRYS